MAKGKKKLKKEEEPEGELLESMGPDKAYNERVFNYKLSSEEIREVEVRGISFIAKFYKTTTDSTGIRVPLTENSPLFEKFYEYCLEIKDQRIEKEKEAHLIAFTTFGKLDKGLEFLPKYGFYVYPFLVKGKKAHLIFNQEKDTKSPMERLEAFVEYYRKKLGIKVRPRKSSFDSLRGLDLTEI